VPQQRQSKAARSARAELLVAIILILAVITIMGPVLRRTYQTSLILRCRHQLVQIFGAVRNYAQSSGGYPPCQDVPLGEGSIGTWREQVDTLLQADDNPRGEGKSRLWGCPAGGGYVGNVHVFGPPHAPMDSFRLRLEIGVIADGAQESDRAGLGGFGDIEWRHRGGANVIFLDGRVQWIHEDKAWAVRRYWDGPQ